MLFVGLSLFVLLLFWSLGFGSLRSTSMRVRHADSFDICVRKAIDTEGEETYRTHVYGNDIFRAVFGRWIARIHEVEAQGMKSPTHAKEATEDKIREALADDETVVETYTYHNNRKWVPPHENDE
jgi:hypothetical protein